MALYESPNALWKHYILVKDLDLGSFRNAFKDLLSLWNGFTVIPAHEIAGKSLDIAIKEKATIYDSLYLALAQQYNACLATFDTRQHIAADKLGIRTCL
ncbi:type II toxin-antitoxin system VapC family toxin [Staphylothermus marinus]|uniref:type II toxin-antitoxin system VapC family toxin n=1 Tax=Staphylothermus marinus TaxID=2280 RepID=UPI0011E50956